MGYFTCFINAGFLDFIIPGYLLLILYTTFDSNLSGYLSQFFGIMAIYIVYDLFGLIFVATVLINLLFNIIYFYR